MSEHVSGANKIISVSVQVSKVNCELFIVILINNMLFLLKYDWIKTTFPALKENHLCLCKA